MIKVIAIIAAIASGPMTFMGIDGHKEPDPSLFPDPSNLEDFGPEFKHPNYYVRKQIYKGAKSCNMNPWILMGIASRESDFRHSLNGDGGESFTMFQIHRGFHPEYASRTSENMTIVQACGAVSKIMRPFIDRFANVNEAIAAYNGGAGGVSRAIKKHGKGHHDKATTGGNYSEDELARSRVLKATYWHEVDINAIVSN